MLTNLLRTPEEASTQAATCYRDDLGRALDAGAACWTSGVEDGCFPLERALQDVLASRGALRQGSEVASDVGAQVVIASSAEIDRVSAARAVHDGSNPARRAAQVVPAGAVAAVTTVVEAARGQGVPSTVKHLPGLGRVRANTDTPSRAVDDGVSAVMVSPAMIDGLLRTGPGFTGLVLTDDRGAAVAVRSVPTGQRAVRVIRAGATMVLTIQPDDLGPVEDVLTATAASALLLTAQLREAPVTVLATRMPTR